MPSQVTITVKPSLSVLARRFGKINVGSFMQGKIRELAFLVERESKKVTPVDTGRLRASIGVSLQPMVATVAPHTEYATYVHEGTRYMKARPYMFWGAKTATEGFDQKISKELESYIQAKIR